LWQNPIALEQRELISDLTTYCKFWNYNFSFDRQISFENDIGFLRLEVFFSTARDTKKYKLNGMHYRPLILGYFELYNLLKFVKWAKYVTYKLVRFTSQHSLKYLKFLRFVSKVVKANHKSTGIETKNVLGKD